MAAPNIRPEGDERFVYIADRHWAALVMRAIVPVLVGVVAIVFLGVRMLSRQPDFLGQEPPPLDALNVVLLVSVLVTIAITAYIWLDWRNDHLIVSNKRVIHEDRTLWLSYHYETIPLDQIQNVNVRTENVFQYVLHYGRVEVQAAGPTEPIIFDRACRPVEVQQKVLGEVQREKRTLEQKRLAATVERRLNPKAPTPPPIPIEAADEVASLNKPLQAVLPLTPVVQNGIITWHRHWVVLLEHLVWPFVASGVWLALLWAIPRFNLLGPVATFGVLFGLFVALLFFFFWQYENWRNDVYVLEPTKIIDIQRLPFGLYEDRREATLGVIQNVNASSPNLFARLLGYGDVLIETAGAGGNFTFDHVPNPDQVQRLVFEYRERFRWQQREREWNNTLNIIDLYYRTHNSGNSPQS